MFIKVNLKQFININIKFFFLYLKIIIGKKPRFYPLKLPFLGLLTNIGLQAMLENKGNGEVNNMSSQVK